MIEKSEQVYATVELAGRYTRGQLVCYWSKKTKKEPNMQMIVKYSTEKMEQLMMEVVLHKI